MGSFLTRFGFVPIGRGYVVVLALAAAFPAIMLVRWFVGAIPLAYGLDYNEGIVWQQMADIVAGKAYGPIDRFPAIVYHYPPAYHLLTAAVAATGIDALAAGRLVSLCSTLGSAILVGALSHRLVRREATVTIARLATGASVFCFLGCAGVQDWAPLMRVDPAACFFALLGLWLAVQAGERPRLIYLAAASFVVSVFCKQNSVVTAAAAFLVLGLYRPGTALRGMATCLLLGGGALVSLVLLFDSTVLNHLVLYNINRFDFSRLLPNLVEATRANDRPLIALGLAGTLCCMAPGSRAGAEPVPRDLTRPMVLAFAGLATLSLVTTAKYGSSSAYYMQWEAALAILSGSAVTVLLRGAEQARLRRPVLAALFAAVPLLLTLAVALRMGPDHLRLLRRSQAQGERLAALVRPLDEPILSNDMVLLLRTGHRVVWEPAIFRELAFAGLWDERTLVKRIRDGHIAAVLSDGDRGYKWFDEQFSPAIADAMDATLPRKEHVGNYVLHLPPARGSRP
ncbi:hypothetical protein [Sphingomonas aracearum]|uniref:Glycosyltransferase RgtA/B/C/D-like domain-containing protein n=1 Tax=Sphingomonas aracearum TaxID=2283317 RepID=A0A369VXJ2_9SPHN|nr:hypothetical protein [Sphingomonas aracearum]RDE04551.1 hypothetical protein DVW87_13170 [Sphingomonas aracearum]